MGGLVARAYIQSDALYQNDIDRFVMIGTPNHGMAKFYYEWESSPIAREKFDETSKVYEESVVNPIWKAAVHYLYKNLSETSLYNYVQSYVKSVQDLLPTFDYLRDQNGNTRKVSDMVWQNIFLKGLNAKSNISKLSSSLSTKMFTGEGYDTLETINVIYPNPENPSADPEKSFPDGKPESDINSTLGDRTVLTKSAVLTETTVPTITRSPQTGDDPNWYSHTNLPKAFTSDVVQFIAATTTEQIKSLSFPQEVLSIYIGSPVDLLVTNPQGKQIGFNTAINQEVDELPNGAYSGKDELGQIVVVNNPEKGTYRVQLTGVSEGNFLAGAVYSRIDCAFDQDNFGKTATGTVTTLSLDLQGGCDKNAFDYALDAIVDIDPNTLNLSSKGSYITAYIELPALYKVEDIDVSTVKLNGTVPALTTPATIGDYDKDGVSDLMVKFERNKVQPLLSLGDNIVSISGNLTDGTRFGGKDTIKAINTASHTAGATDWNDLLAGLFGLASGGAILRLVIAKLII